MGVQYESMVEPSKTGRPASREQVVSLLDILVALWAGKWLILLAAVAVAVAAATTSRLLEKQYEASVVVSVVSGRFEFL